MLFCTAGPPSAYSGSFMNAECGPGTPGGSYPQSGSADFLGPLSQMENLASTDIVNIEKQPISTHADQMQRQMSQSSASGSTGMVQSPESMPHLSLRHHPEQQQGNSGPPSNQPMTPQSQQGQQQTQQPTQQQKKTNQQHSNQPSPHSNNQTLQQQHNPGNNNTNPNQNNTLQEPSNPNSHPANHVSTPGPGELSNDLNFDGVEGLGIGDPQGQEGLDVSDLNTVLCLKLGSIFHISSCTV